MQLKQIFTLTMVIKIVLDYFSNSKAMLLKLSTVPIKDQNYKNCFFEALKCLRKLWNFVKEI